MATKTDKKPGHEGDILGLGTADPQATIPQATHDHGGHPKGIELDARSKGRMPGANDVVNSASGPGATGIDMGGSGDGTQITEED
jgi:hypothetical protein